MKTKLRLLFVLVFLLTATALGGCSTMPSAAKADAEYPAHSIKVIVPFAAGGGTDSQARALSKVAAKHLKHPLVILNKPGGGGNIGLSEVARSAPDGYTLGLSCPEIIFHSVYGTTKYHYLTALDPIVQFSSVPFLLVVNAESPWNSVEEMLAYGKSSPLKFSHGGIGSASHVLGEVFSKLNNITSIQVPFRGGSEKTAMLLGKHVDATFIAPAPVKEYVKAGKLKVLAITGSKRMIDPLFADVPTLQEHGIDIDYSDWCGIASPKPLPPEIKAKLAADLKEMIQDPELKSAVEMLGAQLDYLGPEESQQKWIEDAQRLKKMVVDTRIIDIVKKQQGVV